ncbi:MAG: 4Fe-4S dicluster domain-containing protein [Tissierellia bacterium]|mgnify:CR=1 FL=1|nr:4Fe-4S dicluster domain-containing protein [Tissierellia bacterium]
MAKGKVTIKQDRCKGCGLCVSVCPKEVLALDKKVINDKGYNPASAVKPEECIGCANCALICPDVVITVERD